MLVNSHHAEVGALSVTADADISPLAGLRVESFCADSALDDVLRCHIVRVRRCLSGLEVLRPYSDLVPPDQTEEVFSVRASSIERTAAFTAAALHPMIRRPPVGLSGASGRGIS